MTVARGIVRSGSRMLPGRDRRAFEAEERPQRQRGRRHHAAARARAVRLPRSRKVRGLEASEPGDADDGERQDLERRRDDLHAAGRPDAARTLTPSAARASRRRAPPRGGVADDRGEERIEIADKRHRQRRVRGTTSKSSSPRRRGSRRGRRMPDACRRRDRRRRDGAARGARRPARGGPIRPPTRASRRG